MQPVYIDDVVECIVRCFESQETLGRTYNLVGDEPISMNEFVDLIAEAAYVMCLDSSTSHVAAAFGIPSTVIMPGINEPKLFAPANDRASILKFKTPCSPCFRGGGCEHMACIRGVTVEEATASVLKGLDLASVALRP